jgi:ankyrin repeat protein
MDADTGGKLFAANETFSFPHDGIASNESRCFLIDSAHAKPYCCTMQDEKHPPLPLHHAIRHGDTETLQSLIQQGHAIEQKSPDPPCWSPLHLACHLGHITMVKILLGAKANSQARDINDHTPLCLATQGNHLDIIALFIGHGANLNECYMDYRYLIHIAAENPDTRALSYLLQHQPSLIHQRERHLGDTPLYTAIKCGNIQAMQVLMQHGATSATSLSSLNPLQTASHANHPEAIGLLLQDGAEINATTAAGYTALDIALIHLRTEAAVTLISYGAQSLLASECDTLKYPIHAAIRCHMEQCIPRLLQRGYSIHTQDDQGATPLDVAIQIPTSMAYPIIASQGGRAAIETKSASTLLTEAIEADNMPRASHIYHHASLQGNTSQTYSNRTAEYIRYCQNQSVRAYTCFTYRKIKPLPFSQHLHTLRLIALNYLKKPTLPLDMLNYVLYLAGMIPEHTNILYLLPLTWTQPPPKTVIRYSPNPHVDCVCYCFPQHLRQYTKFPHNRAIPAIAYASLVPIGIYKTAEESQITCSRK